MNKLLAPGLRTGCVRIPSSKSVVHRLLVCAALGKDDVLLRLDGLSRDIQATADCLCALGASVKSFGEAILVRPIAAAPLRYSSTSRFSLGASPSSASPTASCDLKRSGDRGCDAFLPLLLPACESGSTLRFLLPLVGVLGCEATFAMHGRLSERPLAPYDSLLEEHGMHIRRDGALLHCSGQLRGGDFQLPGNISSQYFSGLLMSLPLLPSDSRMQAEGLLESPGYIALTEDVLRLSSVRFTREEKNIWQIPGLQRPKLPHELRAEGDWSNAAFFLCLGALSEEGVTVSGLFQDSAQGDRAILGILRDFGACLTVNGDSVAVRRGETRPLFIDARDIPDLVPVLAVLCCAASGTSRITGAARLRYKESDRLRAVRHLIRSLGGEAEEQPDGLTIRGTGTLRGGRADAFNDHRIAMSAAVASAFCSESVEVCGAECVEKSYPAFWRDFFSLQGGVP